MLPEHLLPQTLGCTCEQEGPKSHLEVPRSRGWGCTWRVVQKSMNKHAGQFQIVLSYLMRKIGLWDGETGVGLLDVGVGALGRLLWPEFGGQNDE